MDHRSSILTSELCIIIIYHTFVDTFLLINFYMDGWVGFYIFSLSLWLLEFVTFWSINYYIDIGFVITILVKIIMRRTLNTFPLSLLSRPKTRILQTLRVYNWLNNWRFVRHYPESTVNTLQRLTSIRISSDKVLELSIRLPVFTPSQKSQTMCSKISFYLSCCTSSYSIILQYRRIRSINR